MTTPAVALTVAGVDSAGGAGLHADLRAFAAHGVHGASVVAAVTAQSTQAIDGVHLIPSDFVAAQLEAVLGDLSVAATKTGFLASPATVAVVAAFAAAGRLPAMVVDPVLVSSSGALLFPDAVLDAYRDALLPHALVLTPNRLEAAALLGRELHTVRDMTEAARELRTLGPDAVIVKGGDAEDEGTDAVDILATASGVTELRMPRIDTANDHGSGCSFAAAIAAKLSCGSDIADAVHDAKSFVHRGLIGGRGWRLGAGHGPIDALGWETGHR